MTNPIVHNVNMKNKPPKTDETKKLQLTVTEKARLMVKSYAGEHGLPMASAAEVIIEAGFKSLTGRTIQQ